MKIYPIAEQLEMLLDSFSDPETGEMKEVWINPFTGASYTLNEEVMQEAIEQVQMNFDDKIVDLRNDYINSAAEADAIRAEKKKLEKRLKFAENRAERDKRWIAYLLKGEKFKKDATSIAYKASEVVRFRDDDSKQFVAWAKSNFPSLLNVKEPEPNKTEIKKAIKAGLDVDYAYIQKNNNVIIK